MRRNSGNTDRRSLAATMMRNEQFPSVVATKTLIRAGFLFADSPRRPYHKLGLNLSQVDVLAALARSETGLNCSKIADTTLITKGGITGILDRLEARGLVQRTPSSDDRRSIRIQLTEKGVGFCSQLFAKLVEDDEKIFARALTPAQIKQLTKLLTLFLRSIEADSETVRSDLSEAANHGHERI